jgi:ABC-type transporter Mla subunit MlaD
MDERLRYQLERISHTVNELQQQLRRTRLLLNEALEELADIQAEAKPTSEHAARQ